MLPGSLLDWLLQNSGPVIRWRTASELVKDFPPSELRLLKDDLLAFPGVQSWLDRLVVDMPNEPPDWSDARVVRKLGWSVHSSQPSALENVLGKLSELGLRAGMPDLDERMLPLRQFFRWQSERKGEAIYQTAWESLVKSIFAWGLLHMGFKPDESMKEFLLQHLQLCHKIARDQVYDLYASDSELAGLPKAWAGKPILKQEVMVNYFLPLIHDIYIFASFPEGLNDQENAGKIDDIITYILDPRFQALQEGYGYAWIKERHTCYGWGWSPHLPHFQSLNFAKQPLAPVFIQRLELMSHFPRARRSPWFQGAVRHLDSYRTEQGTYRFPTGYLREQPSGYYVTGAYLGLGENRRRPLSVEVESTFRILKILHAVDYNL